jgi:hypothetical protein
MKTTSYQVSEALKDVWRWRDTLTAGDAGRSVEERLQAIARRGDEAARRFGFDGQERAAECVAEEGGAYDVGRDQNPG